MSSSRAANGSKEKPEKKAEKGFWEKRRDRLSTYMGNWWDIANGREPKIKLGNHTVEIKQHDAHDEKAVSKFKKFKKECKSVFHGWLVRTSMMKYGSTEEFWMSEDYIKEGAIAYDRHKFVSKRVKKATNLNSIKDIDDLVEAICKDYVGKGWISDASLSHELKSSLKQYIVDKKFWKACKNALKQNPAIKQLYTQLQSLDRQSTGYIHTMKLLKDELKKLDEYQIFSSVHKQSSDDQLEWHLKQSIAWAKTHFFSKYEIDFIDPSTEYRERTKSSQQYQSQKSRMILEASRLRQSSHHSRVSPQNSPRSSQKDRELKVYQPSSGVGLGKSNTSPVGSPRYLAVPDSGESKSTSVENTQSLVESHKKTSVPKLQLSSIIDGESPSASLSARIQLSANKAADASIMPMPTLGGVTSGVVAKNPLVYLPFVPLNAVVSGFTEFCLRVTSKSKVTKVIFAPTNAILVLAAVLTKAGTKLGAEIVNLPVTAYDEYQLSQYKKAKEAIGKQLGKEKKEEDEKKAKEKKAEKSKSQQNPSKTEKHRRAAFDQADKPVHSSEPLVPEKAKLEDKKKDALEESSKDQKAAVLTQQLSTVKHDLVPSGSKLKLASTQGHTVQESARQSSGALHPSALRDVSRASESDASRRRHHRKQPSNIFNDPSRVQAHRRVHSKGMTMQFFRHESNASTDLSEPPKLGVMPSIPDSEAAILPGAVNTR